MLPKLAPPVLNITIIKIILCKRNERKAASDKAKVIVGGRPPAVHADCSVEQNVSVVSRRQR